MADLLELRKELKSKKPKFVRQQGHGLKKLSKSWRAPKGMHSKLRKKLRGHLKQPSRGYSSPKAVRGFSSNGFKPVVLTNENQIDTLEKNEGIIISKRLGERKRLQIFKKIKEKNLTVLNIKDIDSYISKIEGKIKKRKEKKSEKKKKKEASTKKSIEKAKQKEKKEETPEEKEKKAKEEKRKILESGQ